jgi:hypothetical protein
VKAARAAQKADAADLANLRPAHRPKSVYTNGHANGSSVHASGRPSGNSRAAFLRRLRKDRPDIHARVLAGELSPHASMIEAGFRKNHSPSPAIPAISPADAADATDFSDFVQDVQQVPMDGRDGRTGRAS